eukprot:6180699-Pleurochrysis_carterae.AAC.1
MSCPLRSGCPSKAYERRSLTILPSYTLRPIDGTAAPRLSAAGSACLMSTCASHRPPKPHIACHVPAFSREPRAPVGGLPC